MSRVEEARRRYNLIGGSILTVAGLALLSTSFLLHSSVPLYVRAAIIVFTAVAIAIAAGLLKVQNPQDVYGGMALILLALIALIASNELPGMRGFAFGPGTAPRLFAWVLAALSTGVVDGTENPPSNEYTQKMHEVQKYTMRSQHGYVGYAVIANKKFWDGLPADIRANLEKAMAEATAYTNDIAQKENDDALEAMRKSGKTEIVELNAEQKAAWRKALDPVYAEMSSRVGKDTIAEFQKEAGGGATH